MIVHRHKAHVRPRHRLADRRGIDHVVPASLDREAIGNTNFSAAARCEHAPRIHAPTGARRQASIPMVHGRSAATCRAAFLAGRWVAPVRRDRSRPRHAARTRSWRDRFPYSQQIKIGRNIGALLTKSLAAESEMSRMGAWVVLTLRCGCLRWVEPRWLLVGGRTTM